MRLGSKVRDKITGFVGIATSRVEHLYGTPRVLVESQIDGAPEKEPVYHTRVSGPSRGEEPVGIATMVGRIAMGELHEYWFDEGRLEPIAG